LKRAIEKNSMDANALLRARMPDFVVPYGRSDSLPVFCFHDVAPETFERQLQFLQSNGYRSLSAEEVEQRLRTGESAHREIALTFDDATSSFWSYAYPLLRAYEFTAVLFVVPSLIQEADGPRMNWQDQVDGRCTEEELASADASLEFCTWPELLLMHESGYVDIQSHSLTHVRVPVSARIIDYLHPQFPTYYGNFDIPLSRRDDVCRPARLIEPGYPVFASAPRLEGRRRFIESEAMINDLQTFIAETAGADFHERSGWRSEFDRFFRGWPRAARGEYESHREMSEAIRREFAGSKSKLEERLPGKSISHFCYPWFKGSSLSDDLAAESGYRTVFCGSDLPGHRPTGASRLFRIQRVGEEFLYRLPGKGRRGLASVLAGRLR
jgi:hypothetical protein